MNPFPINYSLIRKAFDSADTGQSHVNGFIEIQIGIGIAIEIGTGIEVPCLFDFDGDFDFG